MESVGDGAMGAGCLQRSPLCIAHCAGKIVFLVAVLDVEVNADLESTGSSLIAKAKIYKPASAYSTTMPPQLPLPKRRSEPHTASCISRRVSFVCLSALEQVY